MASKVQLCNMALSGISGKTITSLTDGTEEARLCNTFFDVVARWVMAEGPWSSCIESSTLARTSSTPGFEFLYEYQLPTDCLRILEIQQANEEDGAWIKKGDKIWTDLTECKIKYIKSLSDPQQYGPELEQAIVIRLQVELARPLAGGSQGLREALMEQYKQAVQEGLNKDGLQGSNILLSSPDLDEVRHG